MPDGMFPSRSQWNRIVSDDTLVMAAAEASAKMANRALKNDI